MNYEPKKQCMTKNIYLFLLLNLFLLHTVLPCSSKFFILIGPSGVGKSTLIQKLLQIGTPCDHLITYTTRSMRPKEQHAQDYFFISDQEFIKKIENNEFISFRKIYDNYYGISKDFIHSKLQSQENIISALTGDVAQEMKTIFDKKVVSIFISIPSLDVLKKRLIQRQSETEHSLNIRLASAKIELQSQNSFDYNITNDNFEKTLSILKKIILQELTK